MSEFPSIFVVLAALISGMILGLNLRTNAEYRLRGAKESLVTIFRTESVFGVALNQVFSLLLVSVAAVAAAVFIMRIGDVCPLSKMERYVFCFFWFAAVAFAKYVRFFYWKNKCR